ncbi:MAG: LacI family DNA-binding transcriptional regulator [Anaerolineae bacterium]|nr:LacI family DNA-binding transcriptional regulator [Anaerolineae bacterium]
MPNSKHKRVTIRDIAKACDVSHQTVSRVINNSPGVSPKKRQQILRVMKELNYQPNKAAQMLSSNRSQILETIIVDVDYAGTLAKTTKTMVHAARKLGYGLLVSETSAETLPGALENAAARLVDGIILYAPNLQIDDAELLALCGDIPFVRRDYVPGSKVAWVGFNQGHAGRLAVEHLVALGHREIAEISPPRHYHNGYWRHQGYLEALEAHGLRIGPNTAGNYSMQSGYEGVLELLASGQPFTAIVVGTDKMALGALHALREKGLSVPGDISIIGFDNSELAGFAAPPLTTVEFKFEKQDEMVVKYLVELIKDPQLEIHQRILMPELIVRESTRRIDVD